MTFRPQGHRFAVSHVRIQLQATADQRNAFKFRLIEFNGKQLSRIGNCFHKYVSLLCNSAKVICAGVSCVLCRYNSWPVERFSVQ